MKILQVAPPWIDMPPKGYGGTEAVIGLLTDRLVRLGHSVTLFATKASKSLAKLEFVYNGGLYEKGMPWEALLPVLLHYHKAIELARKKKFDIVHAHISSPGDLVLFPLLSSLNMPVVATVHSPFPFDAVSHMDDAYINHYAQKVPVVNISRYMDRAVPGELISMGVVYNSISLEQYAFSPAGGKDLVWFGRIHPNKGIHEAIRVAKAVGRRLLFAGVVDARSEISTRYFNEKIKPHIDGKQIIFFGEADVTLKNKLLASAAAFINPIQWDEPFGLVMAESQAVGTPVITYNRGAAPEVVRHGQTGFVVNSFEEMTRAVGRIPEIGRGAARAFVQENFGPQRMTERYLQAYDRAARRYFLYAKDITQTLTSPESFKAPLSKLFPNLQ